MQITKEFFSHNDVRLKWETDIGTWIEVNGKEIDKQLEKEIQLELNTNEHLYGEKFVNTVDWRSEEIVTVLTPEEIIMNLKGAIWEHKNVIIKSEKYIKEYETLLAKLQEHNVSKKVKI